MSPSLAPGRLKRYRDILVLLARHGRGRVVKDAALEEVFRSDLPDRQAPAEAADLVEHLEELGPTFVKLGQLLSTRPDLLPPPYLDALARLQDRLEPFPMEEVERIVQEELGVRISKAFSFFEDEPLAAASLGQVHRAALRDGRPVAVKVQRPGVREQVQEDLEVLEEVASLLERHPPGGVDPGFRDLVAEFRRTIAGELDYRAEAANLRKMGELLEEFERIVVPAPVDDYTTSRVLTMDFVAGRKVTALGPLTRLELDGEELVDELFQAYLQQVLVHGFFHADPHPGNVFLTPERKLALLDLGMVARVGEEVQEQLVHVVLAVADGRGRDAADAVLELASEPREGFDREAFRRELDELVRRASDLTAGSGQVGGMLLGVTRTCAERGLRMPTTMALLGRTFLSLDEIARTLAPDYDPNAAVRRYAADLLQHRMWRSLSPTSMASSALELTRMARRLPARLGRILELASENRLSVRVDAIDEARLMEGLQKIANRITAGLVIAALLVSAAMLMRVDVGPTIFGYPAFAALLFLLAVICGFGLLLSIVRKDHGEGAGRRH